MCAKAFLDAEEVPEGDMIRFGLPKDPRGRSVGEYWRLVAWRQGGCSGGSGPGQVTRRWRSEGLCNDEKCSGDKVEEIRA